MALNIRNPETERLARRRLADELDDIAQHCARLPVGDARPPDEVLGYDAMGLPR